MPQPALAHSPEDVAYVRSWFAPLAEVARPEARFGEQLPAATYQLADGTRWFARDVWRIADDAGGLAGARALFFRRYRAACDALQLAGDVEQAWVDYLAGDYGACLRDVTPETIAAKQRLVARLTPALAQPRPLDAVWRAQVRADVEALDGLEKPFAACDRARYGATTRDRLITAPRAAFPAVFEGDAATRAPAADLAARFDVAIRIPHRPGALAALGEALGRAGCNILGGGAFAVDGAGHAHFLFADAARPAEAARTAGFEVLAVREVAIQRLDQGTPGQLGAITRLMAEAGVNIEAMYSDHDHQLILGVDDLPAARRVAAAWATRAR